MSAVSSSPMSMLLGFDPGRDKCGLAVMGDDRRLLFHQVVVAHRAIETIASLNERFGLTLVVMGDQTSAEEWQAKLCDQLSPCPPIVLVDERYTSLEARDRYWQMYPPKGLGGWLPKGLRQIDRPIDDIVAILLIERYWEGRFSKRR